MEAILPAWGRILTGYKPALAIEITRECPLRCPGCYAYNDEHLRGEVTLREVRDFKGQELVDAVLERYAERDDLGGDEVTLGKVGDFKGHDLVGGALAPVDLQKPLHVSIVGG